MKRDKWVMHVMVLGCNGPAAWLCRSLDHKSETVPVPRCWGRALDASRLQKALRPHEKQLQDLCASSKLSAVLNDAETGASGLTGHWR